MGPSIVTIWCARWAFVTRVVYIDTLLGINIFGSSATPPRKPTDTDIRPDSSFGQYRTRVALYFALNFIAMPTRDRKFDSVTHAPFNSRMEFLENRSQSSKTRYRRVGLLHFLYMFALCAIDRFYKTLENPARDQGRSLLPPGRPVHFNPPKLPICNVRIGRPPSENVCEEAGAS